MTEYDERLFDLNVWKGKTVQHFKGDQYLFIDVVEHTETGEDMALYKALYGDCRSYVRPLKMFLERCNKEQFNKYGQVYRFELVNNKSIKS